MNVSRFLSVLVGVAFCTIAMIDCCLAEQPTLKEAFAQDFLVGVALGTDQVLGQDPAAMQLAAKECNAITPENLLKWAEVHPQPDQYNFGPADRYVEFGQQHGMFIVGHTLVWHNQTPAWVFEDGSGNPADRETLLARMREHIHAVVGRYKGRVNGWDVVNEAVEDDGTTRQTPWQRIIGDDYLEKAFQFAHEADPDAELYYNDYNMWHPGKRRAVPQLVRNLQSKGIRIDGLGIQGHWGMDYPSLEEMEAMFQAYGQLGVKLMITELDMNVLPSAWEHRGADVTQNYELRKALDPYADGLPADMQQALANRYADIFRVFLKHHDKIARVTFWGVYDGHSWLNNWPVRGRTAYPLLFDRQYQPKPAFEAVIKVAGGQP